MNLRIGLVGLGTGGRSLPHAVAKTTGFTFVAGADLREEARAQYAADFGIQTFDSVEAMCGLKDLNAVYVATPNPFHAGHAIAALHAGKHVMVEKPMALTLADCDRMIAAAERNRVKLMVAHTRSWNAPIRKMREIISSGRLGRVTQVHTLRYSPWLLRPREPVEIDTALGGGVCYRQAPHQVDIARLLGGGLVESVRAHAGRWSPENDTEGNYSALLQFAGGVTATLIYDGYGYFDDRELIEGDVFGSGRQSSPGQRLRQARAAGQARQEHQPLGGRFRHRTGRRRCSQTSAPAVFRHHLGQLRTRRVAPILRRRVSLRCPGPLGGCLPAVGRAAQSGARRVPSRHYPGPAHAARRQVGQSDAGSLPGDAAIEPRSKRSEALSSSW